MCSLESWHQHCSNNALLQLCLSTRSVCTNALPEAFPSTFMPGSRFFGMTCHHADADPAAAGSSDNDDPGHDTTQAPNGDAHVVPAPASPQRTAAGRMTKQPTRLDPVPRTPPKQSRRVSSKSQPAATPLPGTSCEQAQQQAALIFDPAMIVSQHRFEQATTKAALVKAARELVTQAHEILQLAQSVQL